MTNDFYSDLSQQELEAAAATSTLGFTSRWKAGEEYTLRIDGAKIVNNDALGTKEAVMSVSELKDGVYTSAGEIKLDTSIPIPGSERAALVAKDDEKTKKGIAMAKRTLDTFWSVTVQGYANVIRETLPTGKAFSTNLSGEPVRGDVLKTLNTQREAVMNRFISRMANGDALTDLLVGSVFVYAPKENAKNADFPYHGFKAVQG